MRAGDNCVMLSGSMPSRFAACVVVAAATALALPACHRDRATPAEKAPRKVAPRLLRCAH